MFDMSEMELITVFHGLTEENLMNALRFYCMLPQTRELCWCGTRENYSSRGYSTKPSPIRYWWLALWLRRDDMQEDEGMDPIETITKISIIRVFSLISLRINLSGYPRPCWLV